MCGYSHTWRKPTPALNDFIWRDHGWNCMASGWIAVCLTRINWRWHWGGRTVSICVSVCCHTSLCVCVCVYVHLGLMHTHICLDCKYYNPSELMSFVCVFLQRRHRRLLRACLLADLDFSLSAEHTLRRSAQRAWLHHFPRCHRTQSVRCVYRAQITSRIAFPLRVVKDLWGNECRSQRLNHWLPAKGGSRPLMGFNLKCGDSEASFLLLLKMNSD